MNKRVKEVRGAREKTRRGTKYRAPQDQKMKATQRCRCHALLLRRRSGGGRGVADGVAVDDELDAAVALAAFGGFVRSHGLRFAKAARADAGGRDALIREKVAHGAGAAFGERLVEFVAADAVGMTFDLQSQPGV